MRLLKAFTVLCLLKETVSPDIGLYFKSKKLLSTCFASSPWRPHTEDKRMVLEHTHGLFIT